MNIIKTAQKILRITNPYSGKPISNLPYNRELLQEVLHNFFPILSNNNHPNSNHPNENKNKSKSANKKI